MYDYVKHLQNAEVFIVQSQKTPDQQACRYIVQGPRIYPGDSGVSMQGIAEKPDTCQMRYERARTPSVENTATGLTTSTSTTSCPSTTRGYLYYYCAHAFAAFADCCVGNVTSVKPRLQWWGGSGQINGTDYEVEFHKDNASGWAALFEDKSPYTNGTNYLSEEAAASYQNNIFCSYAGATMNSYNNVQIQGWEYQWLLRLYKVWCLQHVVDS